VPGQVPGRSPTTAPLYRAHCLPGRVYGPAFACNSSTETGEATVQRSQSPGTRDREPSQVMEKAANEERSQAIFTH